jgi:hypothetical protein
MTKLPAPSLLQSQGIEFLYRPGDTPMMGQARVQANRMGLGDLVAKVAQPVARMIDAVAGTDLANCDRMCEA